MLQPWLWSLREFCSQRSVLHECFLTFASTEAVLERGKALTELMPLTALKHTQRTQKQTPRCSQSSLQGSGLHCCSWDTTCALGELGQAGVHEVPKGLPAAQFGGSTTAFSLPLSPSLPPPRIPVISSLRSTALHCTALLTPRQFRSCSLVRWQFCNVLMRYLQLAQGTHTGSSGWAPGQHSCSLPDCSTGENA